MNLIHFTSPKDFWDRCRAFLMEREAENNLIIGNALALSDNPDLEKEDSYLVAFEDRGQLVGAAMQNPKRPLIITRMPDPCLSMLVEDLQKKEPIHHMVGPRKWTEAFKDMIETMTGVTYTVRMLQLLYELTSVNDVPTNAGSLRLATMDDFVTVLKFYTQFIIDALPKDSLEDFSDLVKMRIKAEQIYLWEDQGRVLSMAGWSGKTIKGVRVNAVFTPSEFRKQGYATTCVAALTKLLLAQGRTCCFLYTDQENPTSNSVYTKIGYVPLCESIHFVIDK